MDISQGSQHTDTTNQEKYNIYVRFTFEYFTVKDVLNEILKNKYF